MAASVATCDSWRRGAVRVVCSCGFSRVPMRASGSGPTIRGHGQPSPPRGPNKGVTSLDITISSRHADLSEALVATTRQKLSRLERLSRRLERAEVHFYE